jgi:hypothetical protein
VRDAVAGQQRRDQATVGDVDVHPHALLRAQPQHIWQLSSRRDDPRQPHDLVVDAGGEQLAVDIECAAHPSPVRRVVGPPSGDDTPRRRR